MRVLLWLKGLIRQDEIVEDVERMSWVCGTNDILLKLWDKQEIKYGEVQRVMIIDWVL